MKTFALISILFFPGYLLADTREWTDATGNYSVNADLVARNNSTVVLKNGDGELIMVEIEQLCDADKKYLASNESKKDLEKNDGKQQWKLKNGMEITAKVVEYGRRNVVIRRRTGKIYVNDKPFDNLPEIYQRMIPKIVEHFEDVEFTDNKQFKDWVRKEAKGFREYTVDGVMLELENGDLYGVPFFFFSDDDLEVLEPGWESWLEAEEKEKEQKQQELELRAQALASQRERAAASKMARLHLQLEAVDAGLTDLWRVYMTRPNGYPIAVVVPGRSSAAAMQVAKNKYPNYQVGGVTKVIRRR